MELIYGNCLEKMQNIEKARLFGIEIDEKYFKIAKERIEKELKEGK